MNIFQTGINKNGPEKVIFNLASWLERILVAMEFLIFCWRNGVDYGYYNISCDEEACAHYKITMRPVERILWHGMLYAKGFLFGITKRDLIKRFREKRRLTN